jgi:hypothetical protein
MADYEQVTQDIREGFSRIAANRGDKSVEIIMKEILAVFAVVCEQNNIDKEEFMQAFFEWYAARRSQAMASAVSTISNGSVMA